MTNSITFTEIDLNNHVVYIETDGNKQRFTLFQKGKKGPVTGTGKFFLRAFDLLRHLGNVDPNEKQIFEKERSLTEQVKKDRQIRRICGKTGIVTSKLPRGAW